MNPNEWPEWTDCLGQTFKPGDYVSYAGLSYKTAYLTVGKVERINRYRQNGEEITLPGECLTYGSRTASGQWTPPTYGPPLPSCTVRIIPLVEVDGVFQEKPGTWMNGEYIPADPPKPKTLQRPEMIIKLNWTPPVPENEAWLDH